MSMQNVESPSISAVIKDQRAVKANSGETRPWHLRAKAARQIRREREREEIAEAMRLGVEVIPKVRFSKEWQAWEDDILIRLAGDYPASIAALPHRGQKAIEKRRGILKLTVSKGKEWMAAEDRYLRNNYLKVSSPAGLATGLPGRTTIAIYSRLHRLGLSIPRPAPDTGSPVLDAIKQRCRQLGYTMRDLDEMCKTGKYFSGRGFNRALKGLNKSQDAAYMSGAYSKAIKALGGELHVEWPD